MAKVKTLDVWIVESNRVYTAVPFTVVTDWITQGRLLAEDRIRPTGSEEWHAIEKVRQLAVYLPQTEQPRAEDEAEALEPVAFEVPYKQPRADEEDEVDMIPLIDVSLVLLIYFMMLLAATAPTDTIPVPGSEYGEVVKDEKGFVVLIGYNEANQVRFGLKQGTTPPLLDQASPEPVIRKARELANTLDGKVHLTINADARMPSGIVRDMVARFTDDAELKAKIDKIYTGTSEKKK